MAIETLDQTGELVKGYFYELRAEFTRTGSRGAGDEWIISSRPDEDDLAWSDGYNKKGEKKRFECPLNKEHKTDSEPTGVGLHLCGGSTIGGFVPDMSVAFVNERVAEAVERSGLVRAAITRAPVIVNQTPADDPKIYHLHLSGRNPRRKRRIEPASANKCPFCGFGPLYCPSCGVGTAVCVRCEERWLVPADERSGDDDLRIIVDPAPYFGPIVEVNRWDGSDFCGGWLWGVITRRALDLLLSVHAAPFQAVPIRADVSGLTKEEWDRLEQAKILPKKA